MESTFFKRLKMVCPNTVEGELMNRHTTFRIGGAADYFSKPKNESELSEGILLCGAENVPYLIMGNGSNMLISDNGIEGVVFSISETFSNVTIEGTTIIAGAGIRMSRLSKEALDNGLTGIEFASGIPGTLGGGVYMNAGAYGGEMKDVIKSVTYMDEDAQIKTASGTELVYGYRKSIFTDRKCIIISCQIELQKGDRKQIKKRMLELNTQRNSKQPMNLPSAGSVFKRPEGYFAGGLIEQAGLKGYKIGGAEVSKKHAGFIINSGNATAKDVLDLISHIQITVKEQFSVTLEPEIKLIGR